ncbi:NAD(P)H-dependent oxidoreductase [Candidatus Enterococcus ferrettii]|uniref:Flavodoxin-like fold domain-containing protein n=1 Tax=Candidatus Enterococcus ferrettii TaxID=2815324 RepID=A0ABV0ERF0_9ENTE|nr:NAD(P)H-dependent oxidoreductase [Enterococcus sp. 665A]MBO1342908.1 NAD(P)H-dependent oxidoreductase [Enterococcus sp. 665A]
MKTLILIFYPLLSQTQINNRFADSVELHPKTTVRRLYDIYNHGTIDVLKERTLLEQADRIIFQFPLQWYSSPSLLVEWQEEVFTFNWVFGSKDKRLNGKELLLIVTNDQDKNHCECKIEELLLPFQALAKDLGLTYLEPIVFKEQLMNNRQDLDELVTSYIDKALDKQNMKERING